jgi:hypothetical protein
MRRCFCRNKQGSERLVCEAASMDDLVNEVNCAMGELLLLEMNSRPVARPVTTDLRLCARPARAFLRPSPAGQPQIHRRSTLAKSAGLPQTWKAVLKSQALYLPQGMICEPSMRDRKWMCRTGSASAEIAWWRNAVLALAGRDGKFAMTALVKWTDFARPCYPKSPFLKHAPNQVCTALFPFPTK